MAEPVVQTAESSPASPLPRGLTFRSVVVTVVALFLMGVWIEYEELYNTYGGPLAENSPPNSAVGVILLLMLLSAALYKLRGSLRLGTGELVVIYSALVLAAPLMTQGLWHRLFGLLAAIPHNQDFKSYESLPPMLWPHGPNLCENGRFERGLEGFAQVGGGSLRWEEVDRRHKGVWKTPVLSNEGEPGARASLAFTIPRRDARGRELLVPGENFLLSALVRASGLTKGSAYFVEMRADDGAETLLLLDNDESRPTFALPEGFKRIGVSPLRIPVALTNHLTLRIGLSGEGTLAVQDIQFFNIEAVEAAYAGRNVVRESDLAGLGPDERNSLVVRPDNLVSLAGLRYLLTGFIPLAQWWQPAVAWSLLIGALFAGFLGLNVLLRKQWAENERFTFPQTILPRQLFETVQGADGRMRYAIFRNRIFWIGFAFTLPLVLLKGIQFYYPEVPAPTWSAGLAEYVTSPVAKAYLQNITISLTFCVLAIALLVETDVLFSLWVSFWLFQLWHFGGRAFNLSRVPGYPWAFQQAMGAFIAYAALALFVGRHHLAAVGRRILGRAGADGGLDEGREVTSYRTALLLVAASLAGIVAWGIWTKMGAGASLLFFGYMLVCGFAASKIRAECGAPFGYLTPYYGMQFVAALGGFALFNSTAMLVATIASGFMCTACFLLISPAQIEMMELGRALRVRPRDVGAGLVLGLLGGLFIGGFVLLCWVYGFSANNLRTSWPYEQNWYFTSYRTSELNADRAFEAGTLGRSPETRPLNFLHNPDAKGLGIGAGITAVLTFLRAKLTWFPLHPIGYVLSSSYFMRGMWFTLFLAWLVRLVVFRVGGAQAMRRGLVPFCVGMFLACIASVVIFDVVGFWLRAQGVAEVYSGLP